MYNVWITVKKSVLGIIFGAAAVAIYAIADYLLKTNLGDAPAWANSAWMYIVPMIVGALKGFANWLKNKNV